MSKKTTTKTVPAASGDGETRITFPPLALKRMTIPIIGTSPLITHAWDEKTRRLMLEAQMKKAKAGKAPKDPEADCRGAMYLTDDGKPGIPALAFKSAAVTACTSLGKEISKVAARQAFHVIGGILPIEGEWRMREDMVRVGMGTADIRFRPCWDEWKVKVTVEFNSNVLSAEQVLNLFRLAGFAVGVCEWRPEKNGDKGRFTIGDEVAIS